MIAYAEELGCSNCANVLRQILEKATDRKLIAFAERRVNRKAAYSLGVGGYITERQHPGA